MIQIEIESKIPQKVLEPYQEPIESDIKDIQGQEKLKETEKSNYKKIAISHNNNKKDNVKKFKDRLGSEKRNDIKTDYLSNPINEEKKETKFIKSK